MKKAKKILVLCAAAVLIAAVFFGCTAKSGSGTSGRTTADGKPDTSQAVTLVYYLWGSEGVANQDILKAINAKLKADINATLEIKYIDWSGINTLYPLLFAAGEQFDMAHASPGAAVSYYTLASQGVLTDITDMLDTAAPGLKAAIPENVWTGTKFNGKIYGVPTLYSEFTMYGFAYNRNLREKYGLPEVNSLPAMEAYMDAVVKNEKFTPLNGNATDSNNLYRMFIALTGQWIDAPGIANNENYLVAASAQNFRDIIHPAFTQEFEDWAVRMHEWNARGYWPRDILSAQLSAKDNFLNANSGAFISHQPDWTGAYGAFKKLQPNAEMDAWTFAENNHKIVRKLGVENSTVVSINSKNPERALMAIEKFMTDQSYYELIQYGIKGRQYNVENGLLVQPASYNADVDDGGFAVWSLRNDAFNIPMASEDPRRYSLNEEWDKAALDNPYVGFSFDPTKVSTEISSISNVNSQLGIQLVLGKTQDPRAAVAQYRQQLTQAGIEKVITELKSQLAGFTPAGK
jgi:putative aldouronate transport system substrate-binding protein